MTRHVGSHIESQVPEKWRWKGKRVKIVDGTTLTMPDTSANQEAYPQQGGQKVGLGFPISRLVGITCLSSGALLNSAIGRFSGKGGDEQTLLRSILETFEQGDIMLGDAFYATYFFIAAMKKRGVDILMEQYGARKRSTDFRKGKRLGGRDHLITICKPKKRPSWMNDEQYNEAPDELTVRECKVGGKIMVTTMTCPKTYSKEALKGLYKSRWNIELDIRNIKETMGMGILSCKTPEMIVKEVWVYLLAYNIIRLLMAQSALHTDVEPREISFKHCLQLWLVYWQHMNLHDDIEKLLLLISQRQVGRRPGRIEPRAVKRRPKPYHLLTVPRNQARAEVEKSGHPKKLK